MTEQEIERDMYARAVALIEERYPTGWGGAAVLRAEDGRCFTSVALENAIDTAQALIDGNSTDTKAMQDAVSGITSASDSVNASIDAQNQANTNTNGNTNTYRRGATTTVPEPSASTESESPSQSDTETPKDDGSSSTTPVDPSPSPTTPSSSGTSNDTSESDTSD